MCRGGKAFCGIDCTCGRQTMFVRAAGKEDSEKTNVEHSKLRISNHQKLGFVRCSMHQSSLFLLAKRKRNWLQNSRKRIWQGWPHASNLVWDVARRYEQFGWTAGSALVHVDTAELCGQVTGANRNQKNSDVWSIGQFNTRSVMHCVLQLDFCVPHSEYNTCLSFVEKDFSPVRRHFWRSCIPADSLRQWGASHLEHWNFCDAAKPPIWAEPLFFGNLRDIRLKPRMIPRIQNSSAPAPS